MKREGNTEREGNPSCEVCQLPPEGRQSGAGGWAVVKVANRTEL